MILSADVYRVSVYCVGMCCVGVCCVDVETDCKCMQGVRVSEGGVLCYCLYQLGIWWTGFYWVAFTRLAFCKLAYIVHSPVLLL